VCGGTACAKSGVALRQALFDTAPRCRLLLHPESSNVTCFPPFLHQVDHGTPFALSGLFIIRVFPMAHRPKVLVVDDDENIVSAFEDFLRHEHCTMLSATNATDALKKLEQEELSLLITDIRMKWQSGVTLLMKTKQVYPVLPVIVITGYPNLISEADLRHYGADYVFVKPLELDQLRGAVKACLHRSAAQKNP
jgi:CheY-like chemotaxis protein